MAGVHKNKELWNWFIPKFFISRLFAGASIKAVLQSRFFHGQSIKYSFISFLRVFCFQSQLAHYKSPLWLNSESQSPRQSSCSINTLDIYKHVQPKTSLHQGMRKDMGQAGSDLFVHPMIALYAGGLCHFKPGKRAKSESVETRTQPCSMARAAR